MPTFAGGEGALKHEYVRETK